MSDDEFEAEAAHCIALVAERNEIGIACYDQVSTTLYTIECHCAKDDMKQVRD